MMKNIVIKIDDLAFLTDFVVIKGERNDEKLFILRRPILVTSKANLDMPRGILNISNGSKTF